MLNCDHECGLLLSLTPFRKYRVVTAVDGVRVRVNYAAGSCKHAFPLGTGEAEKM